MTALSQDDYYTVTRLAPVASIDLLLFDETQNLLLGIRKNAPAKGFWFTPGGRIYTGESIGDAILRISDAELGIQLPKERFCLHGVFSHIYHDNFRDDHHGTHYISIACMAQLSQAELGSLSLGKCQEQHTEMKWMPVEELLAHPLVHDYVKGFFLRCSDRQI